MDNKKYIENLVNINKTSIETIDTLENVIRCLEVKNDKDKANFGNLCLILKANRIIADATEAMLMNEDVLKGEDGAFYQKLEDNIRVPENSNKGNDFDIDKKKKG